MWATTGGRVARQAVILAAGMGTRLGRPFPKPLTELGEGHSIMHQQIVKLQEAYPEVRIMIVVGFRGFLVVMIIVAMLVLVLFEGATLAEAELFEAVGIEQFHRCCLRPDRLQRFFEESLQFVADPENDVGVLQHLRLGRFQGVSVWGTRAFDDQTGLSHAFHDGGNQ